MSNREGFNECFDWFDEMQSISDDVNKLITGNPSLLDVYVELPKNRFDKVRGQVYKIVESDIHKYASLFIAESKTNELVIDISPTKHPMCARCKAPREDAKLRPWLKGTDDDLICFRCDEALMAWVAKGNKIENLPIKVQKKV